MLIDLDKKIAFLSNTKVGSTSAEAWIASNTKKIARLHGNPKIKHLNYSDFLKLSEALNIQGFKTVCVVRDPIEKLVSWYKYRCRDQIKGSERWLGDTPFQKYVQDIIKEKENGKEEFPFYDYHFVYDQNSDSSVDKIFKYESIDDFFDYVSDVYGIKEKPPKKNVSPAIQLPRFKQSIKKFRKAFKSEINWYVSL